MSTLPTWIDEGTYYCQQCEARHPMSTYCPKRDVTFRNVSRSTISDRVDYSTEELRKLIRVSSIIDRQALANRKGR